MSPPAPQAHLGHKARKVTGVKLGHRVRKESKVKLGRKALQGLSVPVLLKTGSLGTWKSTIPVAR
jgi:hypothetical protein